MKRLDNLRKKSYIESSLIGEGRYRSGITRSESFDAIGFYEKYKEYIPMSRLQDSDLWRKIVEQRCSQLKTMILS